MPELEAELSSLKRELQKRDRAQNCALQIAKRVQRSMLPKPVHHVNIDIDVRYVPLEAVGGDYCQVLFPDDTSCYVTLCDVAGHGIGPAFLATRVSSEVRHYVLERLSPDEIVRNLNQFVIAHFAESELFLTFFAAKIDFRRNIVTYSGAGHPGPLLIRHQSRQVEVLHSQNLPIGVSNDCLAERASSQLEVGTGDRFLFFTDGLTETFNPEGRMLSSKELVQMATAICESGIFDVADHFLERIEAFRNGPLQDDLTLIVAELK